MENTILEKAKEAFKKLKALGIVISILMIILGAVCLFNPFGGQKIIIWLMVGGLFIYGLGEIITYCGSPKEMRSGISLACGIIWVVLCFAMLVAAVNSDAVEKVVAIAQFDYFIAIMVSFSCIFNAVNDFCVCGKAEELGRSKGGMIASGVLGILAALTIMSYPVGSIITLEMFYAVFLLVSGITLLCRCLSLKTK